MTVKLKMKTGDTLPALKMKISDPSGPKDLSGAAVKLTMRGPHGQMLIDARAATVLSPATAGIVQFDWQAGDLDVAGDYEIEWKLVYSNGTATAPSTGTVKLTVEDSIS